MNPSHITVGLAEDGKVSSRVTRPPGGITSIFMQDGGAADHDPNRDARDSLSPQRPYRMASNFELGDEQPSQEELDKQYNARRRSKPSVNPLTGQVVGIYGNGANSVGNSESASPEPTNVTDGAVPATPANDHGTQQDDDASSQNSDNSSSGASSSGCSKEASPQPKLQQQQQQQQQTPRRGRVPPGGFSTPLW